MRTKEEVLEAIAKMFPDTRTQVQIDILVVERKIKRMMRKAETQEERSTIFEAAFDAGFEATNLDELEF